MKHWHKVRTDLLEQPKIAVEHKALQPGFELASQIIAARLKQGLTQAELAAKIGTQQSAIARLESGTYNPSIQLLAKVAAATHSHLSVTLQL